MLLVNAMKLHDKQIYELLAKERFVRVSGFQA